MSVVPHLLYPNKVILCFIELIIMFLICFQPAAAGLGNATEIWCNDSPDCAGYGDDQCHKDWLLVNCPKKCGVCGTGVYI